MKLTRKAIPFAAALALATMLPAAAAQAQGRYGDYDQRRGGYSDRYDYRRADALARQLAREADRLRREAWSVNRRPSPPVARVLASLDRLDDQAERFARVAGDRRYYNRYGYDRYDQYDRNGRYDRNDRNDRYGRGDRYDRRRDELDNLLDAYADVQDAVSDIRPQRYLAEGLARIDSLVDQLTGGRYGSYDRGYRRGY